MLPTLAKEWYLYVVTNIGVEILMYIQIFILVKAAFLFEGIQLSCLIIKKPNKQSKIDMDFFLTLVNA